MAREYLERRRGEQMPRAERAEQQLARLNTLISTILPHNEFYAQKLATAQFPLRSLDDLARIPFTFKDGLMTGAADRLAAQHTWGPERYVHFHRTSGTRGRPMVVLDTAEDWQWWVHCWQFVLDAADVTPQDRALLAFSFGPFIGFWTAHDALVARGVMSIPTGGLSSLARFELLRQSGATVLLCTPTYALHLAEAGREHKIDAATLGVRCLIVAGEPGGSTPAVRSRLEAVWNAKVIDHAGATEVGAWGYSDATQRGLFVNENEFIAEFLSLDTGRAAEEGELSELVLTTLGRAGAPVIRYRTGDLVRPIWNHGDKNTCVLLEGGVLGRSDDMLVVRGVNIFPSSVAQILHGFPEVVEYRLRAFKQQQLDQLSIDVEDRLQEPRRIMQELELQLGLRVEVRCVPLGSLPRGEGKGAHFVDER